MSEFSKVSVISLLGFSKSGKTTSAEFLEKYLKEDSMIVVKRLSFSKYLKTSLSQEIGIDAKLLSDVSSKEKYRFKMQLHGDLLKEKFGNDFFIKQVSKEIEEFCQENAESNKRIYVIFDDVRFQTEADFIKTFKKNIIIRIVRKHDGVTETTPDYDIKHNPINHGKDHDDEHISEIAQNFIQADLRIYNGSNSLQALYTILRLAMTTAKIRSAN
jgi:hypothetical protein